MNTCMDLSCNCKWKNKTGTTRCKKRIYRWI